MGHHEALAGTRKFYRYKDRIPHYMFCYQDFYRYNDRIPHHVIRFVSRFSTGLKT